MAERVNSLDTASGRLHTAASFVRMFWIILLLIFHNILYSPLRHIFGLRKAFSKSADKKLKGEIMKGRSGLLSAITIALIISCVTQAFSQGGASFAQLNGTVQDANGATIAKGVITLRNLDTNQAYTTTSNEVGYYIVPNLPPG